MAAHRSRGATRVRWRPFDRSPRARDRALRDRCDANGVASTTPWSCASRRCARVRRKHRCVRYAVLVHIATPLHESPNGRLDTTAWCVIALAIAACGNDPGAGPTGVSREAEVLVVPAVPNRDV